MIWLIPIISAAIGWATNWLAIKMLFYPQEPIRFLGISIQGVFPKRKKQLALKIGKVVAEDLISLSEMRSRIDHSEVFKAIEEKIGDGVDDYILFELPKKSKLVSLFMTENRRNKIKEEIIEVAERELPNWIDEFANKIEEKVDVEKIVANKIEQFKPSELESMLKNIIQKELVYIEWIGFIVGFLIGCVQLGIFYFAQ